VSASDSRPEATAGAPDPDDDRFWAGEDGVTTSVDAPSFATNGLDVTIQVDEALQAAYDEAMSGVEQVPSPTMQAIEARLAEGETVEVDEVLFNQLAAEMRPTWDQHPPASSLVHPAQLEALRWFEEHEAEVWAEIDRAAKELAQQEFEQQAAEEERAEQRMRDELHARRRANVPHGYDDDEYTRWDEDDDYAESLFDSYEEDPKPRKVKRPDPVDFELHSLVVTAPDADGVCAIMLQGNWSLDEEHGLGVIIEGGAVVELGPQSITF